MTQAGPIRDISRDRHMNTGEQSSLSTKVQPGGCTNEWQISQATWQKCIQVGEKSTHREAELKYRERRILMTLFESQIYLCMKPEPSLGFQNYMH